MIKSSDKKVLSHGFHYDSYNIDTFLDKNEGNLTKNKYSELSKNLTTKINKNEKKKNGIYFTPPEVLASPKVVY